VDRENRPIMELSEFQVNEIVSALTSGLAFDGGHHKQYYLDRALYHLLGKEKYEDLKDREEWEDGIPA
jgi:hypothetical protein